MIGRANMSDQLAFDSKSLNALRQSSRDNSPESIKAAATQFEALFVNMMLKSMRQAGGGEGGMFDNEQSRMYTSMMDQQISQKMASRGIGLADAMVRQLTNNAMSQVLQTQESAQVPLGGLGAVNQYVQQQRSSLQADQLLASTGTIESNSAARHVQEFTQKLGPHAELASQSTGIPAKFMLGQAALESGWGKKEIKAMDGSTSHNVFGIKASPSWKGRTVDALTTEYVNGVAFQKVEKFRAYQDYSEAFRDYAKLISDNPRYQNVMQSTKDATEFAHALQKAGYATDPHYAQKLSKVIQQSFSG